MTFADIGALLNFLIVIVFIYLVLSLAASMLVEMLAAQISKRGKMLRRRLTEMFDDVHETGFAALLFESPLLRSYMGTNRLPSYLPADGFAKAVIAIVKEHEITDAKALPPVLRALVRGSGITLDESGLEAFRTALIEWYDQAMDRLTGTYRRWARRWLFAAGLFLAVGFNIDFLHITQSVWSARFTLDETVRQIEGVQTEIQSKLTDGQTVDAAFLTSNPETLRKIVALTDGNTTGIPALPVGWVIVDADCPTDPSDTAAMALAQKAGKICTINARLGVLWDTVQTPSKLDFAAIVGWLLSALLVLPGTNFWFDSLSRLFAIRSAGIKPAPSSQPNG